MRCYRPTTLKLASAHCPRAVDFYEENAPAFRDHFVVGIAAHDVLAHLGEMALSLRPRSVAGRDGPRRRWHCAGLIEQGGYLRGTESHP